MEELKLSEIAKAAKGKLINYVEDISIKDITSNIFNVKNGSLFLAFVDYRYNYDELLRLAYEKKASAAIVTREFNYNMPQIIVNDIKTAFNEFCVYYRSKFSVPVIAVTGSCGKTSTKEMIVSVLSQRFNSICKTPASYNSISEITPRVLSLNNSIQVCVLEMGFGGYLGQIKRMVNIARPTIGVITNIGTSHLENLSSRDKVFEAKMELASYFDENSVLIINGDDEYLSAIGEKPYKIIKTSILGNGDYNAEDIVNLEEAGIEFKCNIRGRKIEFRLNVPGIHNIYNALNAIVIGDILGLDAEVIQKGVLDFKPQELTMNIIKLKGNIRIIQDCFNANLASMKAAIDVMNSLKEGRKIAVLGDMLELGEFSEEIHRELGRYLINKCSVLVAVGDNTQYLYDEVKDYIDSNSF